MHLTVLLPSLINRGYTQVYEIIFTQHPPDIGTLKKNGNKSCPNLARFQSTAKQVCTKTIYLSIFIPLDLNNKSWRMGAWCGVLAGLLSSFPHFSSFSHFLCNCFLFFSVISENICPLTLTVFSILIAFYEMFKCFLFFLTHNTQIILIFPWAHLKSKVQDLIPNI